MVFLLYISGEQNGSPPCHNGWSLKCFRKELGDQQPANMHFYRRCKSKRLVDSVGMPYTGYVG